MDSDTGVRQARAGESGAGTTATPWSFGSWYAFTYLSPAPLVGRDGRMR